MILATEVGQYTNRIEKASERIGRILERDKRWFADHDTNAREMIAACEERERAFWALYHWIEQQSEHRIAAV